MRASLPWSILLAVTTACGGSSDGAAPDGATQDGAAGSDARTGSDAPPADLSCEGQRRAGRLEVTARGVSGAFQDRPTLNYFPGIRPTMTAGVCQLWSSQPDFCDPACDAPRECVEGVCLSQAVNLPIGTITVTSPSGTAVAEPSESGYYSGGSGTLWRAGDAIHVEAEGAAPISGWDADLTGTVPLAILGATPGHALDLVEGEGLTMRWTPASPGARVILHLYSDHHGAPGFIQCDADDDAGEIVVAPELGDALIALGVSGIGTYVEGAWTSREDRALVERETGCIEVMTRTQEWIQVETVLDR